MSEPYLPLHAVNASSRMQNLFLGSYATLSILPEPKSLPDAAERSDARVCAHALHFVERGSRLIVTYLNHGIV
jgi:hypothetical protein